jgi:quinol monooxygenase YgiN
LRFSRPGRRTGEEEEDEVERLIAHLAHASRTDAGRIAYAAHRSVDDPSWYVIYECCADERAFQRLACGVAPRCSARLRW